MMVLARLAIAAVWLYQGGWCKLIAPNERHLKVVTDLPGVGAVHARKVLALVGSVEVALAAWVLSGRAPRTAAAAQTALLGAMNGGGLLFSRDTISEPAAMVTQNLALVALIWSTVRR
ncbi:MAG: DoxX-like family protein [Candidatus Dormibacteraeota bacterium]|nr:DoxX-like family protein [Candidatus Dormibacteraeota bacterium]